MGLEVATGWALARFAASWLFSLARSLSNSLLSCSKCLANLDTFGVSLIAFFMPKVTPGTDRGICEGGSLSFDFFNIRSLSNPRSALPPVVGGFFKGIVGDLRPMTVVVEGPAKSLRLGTSVAETVLVKLGAGGFRRAAVASYLGIEDA